METLLCVKGLEKSYGDKKVVQGISFEIDKQEILCFLGPNGAAKSTTINIICGTLNLDKGEILYKGESIYKDLKNFKKQLGVVPQDLALYEDLTAEQNVKFFASLYGLKGDSLQAGIDFSLESVGLVSKRKEKVHTFSGGMKRRLNIACAIAHRPNLLIMDEPTVGIDPQSRNHILESIRKMRENGMTILYTTHYMEEVEEISTRIIIMDHGEIIATGTNEELKRLSGNKKIMIDLDKVGELSLELFYDIDGVDNVILNDNRMEIFVKRDAEILDKIITCLTKQNQIIMNISLQTGNLESVFLDLTGRYLRE
ncbi:antibiotic ABC transporter ATP-binding protein [Enterococcus silesiacus]|uniref:Antibiotic ABC transporter ATP-binding protein n=1 Tax=Enterococcus silesiacus TaxID=332949 RepID=A0A0S3K6X4_9ENTE|nr:ABC transporter ATP-binding protein [Enterococcus silesiacus]ALR99848.1 antibiotic ABC transporter ATP-binding protein [Enterococcus silesiacus]OJG92849.1 hypothetical protein RV15_GL002794 [Enterococcus silesiacus]